MAEIQSITLKKQDQVTAWILGVVGLLVLLGVGYGLFLLMPLLVELAKNTIIFFAELAVLVGMVIGAIQLYTERDLLVYKWKNFVRKLRRAIVAEDPVGVLDTAIKRFMIRIEGIDEKINEADGAKRTQVTRQGQATKKAEDNRAMVVAAQRTNKSEQEVQRYAIASLQWEEAAKEMQPTVELMERMLITLRKARDLAFNTMETMKNQREVLKVRLEASLAGKKAVGSLKAFFGNSSESDMAMMAFDEIELQTNEAEATIEEFMRVIDPALKGQDLKQQADAIAAMERFNTARVQKQLAAPVEDEIAMFKAEGQKVGKQVNPGR